MPKKKETLFKEKVRKQLDALPRSWWVKTQMVSLRGIPDFLGCINGHFVAIELKIDGEEADPLQAWNLNKIIKAGGLGLEATPSGWGKVYSMLIKLSLAQVEYKPGPEVFEDSKFHS